MTTHHPGRTHDPAAIHRPRVQALTSLWMLGVFVVWTAAFIALSAPAARLFGIDTPGGEVPYIENWFGWSAVALIWAAPLVAGVAFAWHALRRDASQRLARVGLIVNGVLLVVVIGPPLLDRILHLR
ncbi:hypothetical protein [Phycicoccus sp. 3266]|jgi:hypothetical protein|uniref:hypothetical protein n=1 Tax=Phycicoccus sp. 3266 TaxID=2817751 RepID=UPI00285EC4A6|nr:hypothetical protein [Phycicoccus sp. 3266]MDR6863241.1 hypothetical protein [Phycicoccus sp. 3266]